MNFKIILISALCLLTIVASADGKTPDENQKTKDKIKQLEEQQRQLLNQAKSNAVLPENKELLQNNLETITRNIEQQNQTNARSDQLKAYIKEINSRIEDCGTENFPVSRGKKLYGLVKVKITFDGGGNLLKSSIYQTSHNPALDRHMLKVVAASAPFPALPTDYFNKNEVFVYITNFKFSHDQTTDNSSVKFHCKFK